MRRHHSLAQFSILTLGPVASLLLAPAAHAQASACDQLKASLAARIDPSIRGYALEAVPAGAPVPPGAKVIGNCEGGARKILFFRSGGAQSSLDATGTAGPTPAPRVSAALAETKPRGVAVQPTPAAQPVAMPAPVYKPLPGLPAIGALLPVPKMAAEAPAAGASASASASASAGAVTQVRRDIVPMASASIAHQASEFGGRHWPWLAALGLLMIGGSLWAWLAHHSAYDAAGLPRGPRIN